MTRALELAQDGALLMQLADAFGGIESMVDPTREFLENLDIDRVGKQNMEGKE